MTGAGIVRASWAGTGLFTATAVVAAAVPDAVVASVTVALALFGAGAVAFAAALLRAAARSRREELTMAGLFFLEGAPRAERRLLFGSLAVQIVVAFATAGARPNTGLAFGVLAPMWGQGLAGLWGARHGRFRPRTPPTGPGLEARPPAPAPDPPPPSGFREG